MELNANQLATLYLILFNISEGSPDTEEQLYVLIDPLLKENNEPTSDRWVPDHDGGPITSSEEVYKAFNDLFVRDDKEQDEGLYDEIGFLLDKDDPTLEDILKTIGYEKD